MSSLTLIAKLLSKRISGITRGFASILATNDKEGSLEVDREGITLKRDKAARKLAEAKHSLKLAEESIGRLEGLIATDTKIALSLEDKVESDPATEQTVTKLCNDIDANQDMLALSKQAVTDTTAYISELQVIFDYHSRSLAEFDEKARKAMLNMKQAKARVEVKMLRQQQREEISGLGGKPKESTSINLINEQAEGDLITADSMDIIESSEPGTNAEVERLRSEINQTDVRPLKERLANLR